MRFRVENLGPLREAEVDLSKDMIVLTGPNNTGKTYLAWSVYGLFKVGQRSTAFEGDPVLDDFAASDRLELDLEATPPDWNALLEKIAIDWKTGLPHIFAAHADQFNASTLSLGQPLDLRRKSGHDQDWLITISDPNFMILEDWKPHTSNVTIEVVQIEDQRLSWLQEFIEQRLKTRTWDRNTLPRVSAFADERRAQAVAARRAGVVGAVQRRLFPHSILFPAERIAVNIFAKELALKRTELVSDLLEALPTTNPADLLQRRAGRYPWPIRDSLHTAVDLQNLSRHKTDFADLADELERAVLGGTVGVSDLGELTFAPGEAPDRHLAVHLTASVVKSLSSLVFYFRHIARPGDFLIIDEPELNLHPDNQRKITRILAKAVHRGFKIMMSTHSDYVLRELNHLVMLSKGGEAAERVIDELGYDRETLLTPDRLGVYLFNEHTARAVDVDETGFEVETIEREIAAMNADSQRIYAALFG